MIRIGPHTTNVNNPEQQRKAAIENGWGSFQTHWGSPQTLQISEKTDFGDHTPDLEKGPIWVVHAAYLSSASPKEASEGITVSYLSKLMRQTHKAGVQFVVLHVGGTKDYSATEVSQRIRKFLGGETLQGVFEEVKGDNKPTKLLVENTANLYPFNRDLRLLALTVALTKNVGWCLDLAHAHAAGIPHDNVRAAIEEAPPDVVHANFPGSLFGSGQDRHGWRTHPTVLAGDRDPKSGMTAKDVEGWDSLIRLIHSKKIPIILEPSGASWKEGDGFAEVKYVQEIATREDKTEQPETQPPPPKTDTE